jgi:hypothetical protein
LNVNNTTATERPDLVTRIKSGYTAADGVGDGPGEYDEAFTGAVDAPESSDMTPEAFCERVAREAPGFVVIVSGEVRFSVGVSPAADGANWRKYSAVVIPPPGLGAKAEFRAGSVTDLFVAVANYRGGLLQRRVVAGVCRGGGAE